jgi:hypothetical protein
MEQHELEIEISQQGKVRVHVQGVKGKECTQYVKLLEEIMGVTGDVEHTQEYYEPPTGVEIKIEQKLGG